MAVICLVQDQEAIIGKKGITTGIA